MKKFNELPGMPAMLPEPNLVTRAAGAEALAVLSALPMRCGGCGSKVWRESQNDCLNEWNALHRVHRSAITVHASTEPLQVNNTDMSVLSCTWSICCEV